MATEANFLQALGDTVEETVKTIEPIQKHVYWNFGDYKSTIGEAGEVGFGVGYADATQDELNTLDLVPMDGTFDKYSNNYGNYMQKYGGVFVCLPVCYFRIASPEAPQYSVYGVNSIEVVPYDRYPSEAAALADGFVIPRCFYDGGKLQPGVFIQKYEASAVSIAGGTYYAGVPNVKGVVSIPPVVMMQYAKTLGAGFNPELAFSKAFMDFITLAHAQQSSTNRDNAWYQGSASGANRPVQNDPSYSAAASHNGQLNGIMQVSQCWWEFKTGITTAGSNGDQGQTAVTENALYLLKPSAKHADLTSGFGGATDAWGTSASLQSGMYDRYELTNFNLGTSRSPLYWGNGGNRIFNDPTVSVQANAVCGIIPYNDASLSSGGVNMMGGPTCGYYTNSVGGTTQNLALYTSGEHYGNHTIQNSFSRVFYFWRLFSNVDHSFRASGYLQG